jgi:hypothetical protein
MLQRNLVKLFGRPRDPAPFLKVFSLREFQDALGPVQDYEGNDWGFKVYGHEMMEAPLRTAFQAIVGRRLADELITYDGCTNVRQMTGGGGWSVHSWGLAIDFNAAWNKFGEEPNMSPELVKCFTDAGFEWGGTWRTPDGMHFQLPKTRG